MIYTPNTALDRQMLSYSCELVREAMALLRRSDHLVRAQRQREELEQERCNPPRPNSLRSDGAR